MKIFISHRRADSSYLIGRIKDRLTTAFGDQSVFRDLGDIPAGVDFRTLLGQETNGCEERHIFCGRDREVRDPSALILSEHHVFFYAQSGAGKNSLINMRLVPELEDKLYEVLPVAPVSGADKEVSRV